MSEPRTVEYHGVSIWSSRTFWFNAANFIIATLSMTEIVTLIPAKYLPAQAAVVAMANVFLRLYTVRPASMIMPGSTSTVEVKRIGPPDPKPMTD